MKLEPRTLRRKRAYSFAEPAVTVQFKGRRNFGGQQAFNQWTNPSVVCQRDHLCFESATGWIRFNPGLSAATPGGKQNQGRVNEACATIRLVRLAQPLRYPRHALHGMRSNPYKGS